MNSRRSWFWQKFSRNFDGIHPRRPSVIYRRFRFLKTETLPISPHLDRFPSSLIPQKWLMFFLWWRCAAWHLHSVFPLAWIQANPLKTGYVLTSVCFKMKCKWQEICEGPRTGPPRVVHWWRICPPTLRTQVQSWHREISLATEQVSPCKQVSLCKQVSPCVVMAEACTPCSPCAATRERSILPATGKKTHMARKTQHS